MLHNNHTHMNKNQILDEITNTRRCLLNKVQHYPQLCSFVDQQLFDLEDRIAELLASQDLIAAAKAHNRCYDL